MGSTMARGPQGGKRGEGKDVSDGWNRNWMCELGREGREGREKPSRLGTKRQESRNPRSLTGWRERVWCVGSWDGGWLGRQQEHRHTGTGCAVLDRQWWSPCWDKHSRKVTCSDMGLGSFLRTWPKRLMQRVELMGPGHGLDPGDQQELLRVEESDLGEKRIDIIVAFGPFFLGTMVIPPWEIGFRTPADTKNQTLKVPYVQ